MTLKEPMLFCLRNDNSDFVRGLCECAFLICFFLSFFFISLSAKRGEIVLRGTFKRAEGSLCVIHPDKEKKNDLFECISSLQGSKASEHVRSLSLQLGERRMDNSSLQWHTKKSREGRGEVGEKNWTTISTFFFFRRDCFKILKYNYYYNEISFFPPPLVPFL